MCKYLCNKIINISITQYKNRTFRKQPFKRDLVRKILSVLTWKNLYDELLDKNSQVIGFPLVLKEKYIHLYMYLLNELRWKGK